MAGVAQSISPLLEHRFALLHILCCTAQVIFMGHCFLRTLFPQNLTLPLPEKSSVLMQMQDFSTSYKKME